MTHSADEIAYWLEAAEAKVYAETYQRLAGDPLDPRALVEGATVSFWLSRLDVGFFNRSIGLGIGQPAEEADVDAVLGAFRAAGLAQYVVQVSPFARPSAIERWLEVRGLRRGRRWAKVWRDTKDLPSENTGLRIEHVGLEDREGWVAVVLAAFEMPAELGSMIGSTFQLPGWSHYLAFDRDMPVGTAAMCVLGDVAWFGFGATLESHRGRGSQGAMFARRLHDAREAGVHLCVTETGEELPDDPNPSYRNMLRSGFRLAYHRQNWLPPAPLEAAA